MTDLIKVTAKESEKIITSADRLRSLAGAFHATGNMTVHRKLVDMAYDIETAVTRWKNEIGKNINESYKQSVQSSVNVLNAALAGTELGKTL